MIGRIFRFRRPSRSRDRQPRVRPPPRSRGILFPPMMTAIKIRDPGYKMQYPRHADRSRNISDNVLAFGSVKRLGETYLLLISNQRINQIFRFHPEYPVYIEKMVPLRKMPCCQSISSIGCTPPDIRFKIDTLRHGDFVSPPFLLCEMASALQWDKPHKILQRD